MKSKSLSEHLEHMAANASKIDFFKEPKRKEEVLGMLAQQIKETVDTSFLSKRDLMLFYAGMQFENKAMAEWGDPSEALKDKDKIKEKDLSKMTMEEVAELMIKQSKASGAIVARASVILLYLKLKMEEDSMN